MLERQCLLERTRLSRRQRVRRMNDCRECVSAVRARLKAFEIRGIPADAQGRRAFTKRPDHVLAQALLHGYADIAMLGLHEEAGDVVWQRLRHG
ncbi:hypothetical protein AWV79_09945 [Cupriavidus sp. UYMMa02A]|nr:hypothetical protein AWV79_09945 [Cupriavidus sp. UYMMa02A]